jgi:hypothetical protein
MDAPRNILQPPADSSNSGHFSRKSSNDYCSDLLAHGAECSCLFNDFLFNEEVYQHASDRLGPWLCSRVSTETKSQQDTASLAHREYLLAQLLFAARDLAQAQLTRGGRLRGDGSVDPMCAECRYVMTGNQLNHAQLCRTGRVLNLLDAISKASPTQIQPERSLKRETLPNPVKGVDEGQPRSSRSSLLESFVERTEYVMNQSARRAPETGAQL